MKTVIVADSDPRKDIVGGIGVYSASLASRLSTTVAFLGKRQSGSIKKNVKYKVSIVNPKEGQKNVVFYWYLRKFVKNMKLSSEDIVHAQRPDWILPFAKKNCKKIITLHGSHFKNVLMKKGIIAARIYGIAEKKAFFISDKIIAVDEDNKKYYSKKYPFAAEKIVKIPVAIDTSVFVPLPKTKMLKTLGLSSKKKIFLYVGRLSKEKRIHLMIKNLKKDETLLIVGTGEEEEKLRSLAVGKDVMFLGGKSQEELVQYYNCADALLLFSTHEGLPTVVLEALSCGVPCVCSRVGELPSLINEKNGVLVSGNKYRKAMDDALSQRGHLNKECRKSALSYDWTKIVKKIEKEVYHS